MNYTRIKSLSEKNVVSQAKLDAARAKRKASLASLRIVRDRLHYATLTAPFDGRVAQTSVENHQFVQAKETILTLQGNKSLDIRFQLPESIINRLRGRALTGDYQAEVVFDGAPEQAFCSEIQRACHQCLPGYPVL